MVKLYMIFLNLERDLCRECFYVLTVCILIGNLPFISMIKATNKW